MGSKMTMEGGALYFAPSSDSTEPIRFLGDVNLDIEDVTDAKQEETISLNAGLSYSFTVDIPDEDLDRICDKLSQIGCLSFSRFVLGNRVYRRLRRIARKEKQQAKRRRQKHDRKPSYDCSNPSIDILDDQRRRGERNL